MVRHAKKRGKEGKKTIMGKGVTGWEVGLLLLYPSTQRPEGGGGGYEENKKGMTTPSPFPLYKPRENPPSSSFFFSFYALSPTEEREKIQTVSFLERGKRGKKNRGSPEKGIGKDPFTSPHREGAEGKK